MKTLFLRQIVPCMAAVATVVGLALPAKAETKASALLVNQWIQQSADGAISGKLVVPQAAGTAVAASAATVGLVSEHREMKTARTDEQGGFRFEGVEPGVYTLISRGANDVCSVVALHVLSADEQAVDLPQELEVAAARVDYASLNMMMIRYLPPAAPQTASVDVDWNSVAAHVGGRSMHRVVQNNGGLSGQIYRPGASGTGLMPSGQTNIFLYRDAEEIRRVISDESGRFEIDSLDPGVYSVLFVGSSGMGLVGFELVAQNDPRMAANRQDGTLIAAQESAAATRLVMQVAPGGAAVDGLQAMGPGEVVSDVVVSETVVGEEVVGTGVAVPMGGGGGGFAGGAGGAGGGGGIGGGGAGGLLGAAGLAVGIVALATDDDDRQPPVATPADL